jgi:hypothetical protein
MSSDETKSNFLEAFNKRWDNRTKKYYDKVMDIINDKNLCNEERMIILMALTSILLDNVQKDYAKQDKKIQDAAVDFIIDTNQLNKRINDFIGILMHALGKHELKNTKINEKEKHVN